MRSGIATVRAVASLIVIVIVIVRLFIPRGCIDEDAAPGHQFKRLYVVGEPDSCRREFGDFISCLRVKLKKRADAIVR